MGTRCLTIFTDEQDAEICVMYRQFDGYPDGHGKELAEFLSGIVMVNGIHDRLQKIANGMGCLAAQVVAHFKSEPGGIYIHAAGTRDVWENYLYFVTGKEGDAPTIEIKDSGGETLCKGTPEQILDYINTPQEDREYCQQQ